MTGLFAPILITGDLLTTPQRSSMVEVPIRAPYSRADITSGNAPDTCGGIHFVHGGTGKRRR